MPTDEPGTQKFNGGRLRTSVQRVVLRSKQRVLSESSSGAASDQIRRSVSPSGGAGWKTFCNAPSTSLYLDQMGDVRACCQNAEYPLGNITANSLREIWEGARTGALREALTRSDFSLGCQFCRWQMAEENESLVYARSFDHLSIPSSGPEWPQQLELSLSNACNLQCVMCNGDWSSSIRTHREGRAPLPVVYDDGFFAELAEFLPHLKIVKLLGGEPFLGKESLRVLDMLVEQGLTPEVHVTTNGTQWSPRVERIMESLPMHVIVSLDGCDKETYESIRLGADFDNVIANLDRFQSYAERHGTEVNLAHCLMTANWRQFADFLRFADARGLPVGVNTVTSPVELSLHQLHPDRLDEVVAVLDSMDDQVRADLGRNRAVWIDQLDRLHHRQRALAEFEDVSYYLGRTILGVPWRRRPDGRDHCAEAAALLESLPDRQSGPILAVDEKEIVTGIVSTGDRTLVGVDLETLVGRHAAELFGVFGELHGDGTPEVLSNDQDLQHWRITFNGATGLVVDAVMAPVVDHAGVADEVRIHLAARTTAPVEPDLGRASGPHDQDESAREPVDLDVWFEQLVAPARVHELILDGEGTVLAISPDSTDVLGLDLSHLVGGSVIDLIEAFVPKFGELGDRKEMSLPAGAPLTARYEEVGFAGLGSGPVSLNVIMDSSATTPDGRNGMRVLLA